MPLPSRGVFAAIVTVVLIGSALAWSFWWRSDLAPPPHPAQVTGGSLAAAPAAATDAAVPDRLLVGVVLHSDAARSHAYIVHQGRAGSYRLNEPVPPDGATLAELQRTWARLDPPQGADIVLHLKALSEDDRFRYKVPWSDDEIEDAAGDLEPTNPASREALARVPDPHEPCDDRPTLEARRACARAVDAEMEKKAAKCEAIEDDDAHDRCIVEAWQLEPPAAR